MFKKKIRVSNSHIGGSLASQQRTCIVLDRRFLFEIPVEQQQRSAVQAPIGQMQLPAGG
jgi:hypothetical protein